MRFSKSSLIVIAFGLFSTTSIARIQDAEFMDVIKKSNASILEEGLPNIAIPLWVERTFHHGAKASWEVNDCGEGGDGRVAPVCVEVNIPQQNGYYLHISSVVGDTEGKKIAKPQLFMVYFIKSENYKAIDLKQIKTIAEAIQLYKTDLSARPK
jgi:hypothetical protein